MKIAIIGGGYSGLAVAKELLKEENEIVIFEKLKNIGGMVNTINIGDSKIEKYYRHIFKSDKEVIDLVKEFGMEKELIWPSTKMGYFINGKSYAFGTPISLLKFEELNFIEKLIFGFNVVHLKLINNYKNIEKYTAEEWLIKRIGKNIYSKIWEPLLISKFGNKKSDVSMAWLWGKMKLRSTSTTAEGEQLGYIKGSYQKLTDRFYDYLINQNVKINTESEVININKDKTKYNIIYKINENDKKEDGFDIVVSTLDYIISKKIFEQYMNEEEKEKMLKINYTSARTMLIVANKSISKYYWLNIGDNIIPFGGIIEHTNFIEKERYNNKNIIYISNYMTEDNNLYNYSKEKLLEIYMKYLNKINNEFTIENIEDYYVFDEKYAQPIIECNYSKILMNNKLKNEKIYICSMPQIYPEDRGMNYAIKKGKEIANEIMKS